ncbi:ACS2L synthetase, partial [Glaucidium brasilianum]|nr:ACS2L synthetase [Glaucidium brasilianum]
VNYLDRHVHTAPDKVALIWEKDEPGDEACVTYRELLELMCHLGNTLKRQGVKWGDRVTIYMPSCPLAVASMLACAHTGAMHTVVFARFSAESLADRIRDAPSETVITVNQGLRGGKVIELKTVDQAVKQCPGVKRVLVSMRADSKFPITAQDVPLKEEMMKEDACCEPAAMDSEDMLFLLYTSGSTGKPKGLVHSQAGYLLFAALTHKGMDPSHRALMSQQDIFGCVADISWITGYTYVVYGPLCNGGTTVLFESTPVHPNPGHYRETVERLKINQFYGAPTAICLLLRYSNEWVKNYDHSSLTGEPINKEAWEWYFCVVSKTQCPVADTWWQTETGGICISPRPSNPGAEILPGMAMRPFSGIRLSILDDKVTILQGNVLLENNISGALCISQAWPGKAQTIYNDHKRFLETYLTPYPGFFFTGDGAYRTSEGYYQLTGWLDDIINISGHWLDTAEVEDVVGRGVGGSMLCVVLSNLMVLLPGTYAFVVLKKDSGYTQETLANELGELTSKIAKYAAPEYVQVTHQLPKTRSGKIMRRVLRKIMEDKASELGDLTTLDNHEAVQQITEGCKRLVEGQKSH